MKELFSNKYIRAFLLVSGGIFIGWIFFHNTPKHDENKEAPVAVSNTIWTCAMHPQIRMPRPGKCPLCGMDLIPVGQGGATIDPDAIRMTKEAAQLANVLTSVVSKQNPMKEIRLYGKVQADERLLQSQVSYLPGRIEKLLVNYTGEIVRRGQTLAIIYSPELVTAQQELIETAASKQSNAALYEATKDKLRQWKLSEKQIAAIENSGKSKTDFEVYANTTGIVTARRVNNGDYISPGTVLFDIADLSRIWIMFDAYESDLPFLAPGQQIQFSIQAMPGTTYKGNIAFIDPVLDPVNRVARVRVEIENKDAKLKPEMFATGVVKANLNALKDKLVIPRTAVLWTGKRSVVYVKQGGTDDPVFKMREIELGTMLGNSYVVESGLTDGEEIVTQGAFSVDATAQLEGKPSMMNQREKTTSASPEEMIDESVPGNQTSNMQAVKKASPKPGKMIISADFKKQLNTLFKKYLLLKDAFIDGNAAQVKEHATQFQQALAKMDPGLLSGNSQQEWTEVSVKLKQQIKRIVSAANISEQRNAFELFNNQFYKTIKEFGLKGNTVYYQFCPMVNHNKGAFWLSDTTTIRNPYFGEKMMNCGEVRETLKY